MASIVCPVCGDSTHAAYCHPEAAIHRCTRCGHAFSPLSTITTAETYAPEYYDVAHRNWFLHPNLPLFAWISRQLPENVDSIIDVGCGKGDFLRYFRSHRGIPRLVGLDLSPNARDDEIEYLEGDVSGLDISEKFDAVVSLAVIEHVPDVRAFARRLVALGRPGALVVVMTLNDSGLLYRTSRMGRSLGLSVAFDRLYSTHHLHHFTPRSLQTLLVRAGLEVVTVRNHNTPLSAIDVPTGNYLIAGIMKLAVAGIFAAGRVTGGCYLQTIVSRVPESVPNPG